MNQGQRYADELLRLADTFETLAERLTDLATDARQRAGTIQTQRRLRLMPAEHLSHVRFHARAIARTLDEYAPEN